MIKIFLTLSLFVVVSCARPPDSSQFSDDYVLIEFAAKLEEDYHQIYPEPLENNKPTTTK
jgi:hypothetical protein